MILDSTEAARIQKDWKATRDRLIADPRTSAWLRQALRGVTAAHPFDGASDAELLAAVLLGRYREEQDDAG